MPYSFATSEELASLASRVDALEGAPEPLPPFALSLTSFDPNAGSFTLEWTEDPENSYGFYRVWIRYPSGYVYSDLARWMTSYSDTLGASGEFLVWVNSMLDGTNDGPRNTNPVTFEIA